MKFDHLESKFDRKFESLEKKFDGRFESLEKKFESLQQKLGELKDHVSNTKVWALLLYIALAAGTFSTMARAFGWI